ncbi:asparagine synthase (glutamine-hydrolyzing) [Microvirga sp. 2TAF3]|uniref:asparagine synthase (glutamine-hydrolyzing) n=1 Tax=Microvirga sp. 2TAF3 TaxID=3233014 RepID=UPI003F98DC98
MCGIAGWALSAEHALHERDLDRLLDNLAHRGPDGAGTWLEWTHHHKHQIALGHRRLAIIDLDGGAQPMSDVDSIVVATYNGEIYNYVELRKELEERGHQFRTRSDTEVLIESYKAWGRDCVSRFRGMFAFVLFDRQKQELFFARDQFGKKPLYLAEHEGDVFFASELPALLTIKSIRRDLDWTAFTNYLVDRYVPGPATLFKSIRKLSPGCYAIWHGGKLEETRYYTPPFAFDPGKRLSLEESLEQFEAALREAVEIRLRSDAPYGAFLSGGLDSSAIVALMAQSCSGTVRTYSVGYKESTYSELAYAREVADVFQTDHHEVMVSTEAFFDAWPDALSKRGAPISQSSDIPLFMLSQAARRDVKMVLSGEGADELLGGYPKHWAEPWVSVYHQAAPAALYQLLLAPVLARLPYSMRKLKVLGRALSERDFNHRMRVWFGGLSRENFEKLARRPFPASPIDPFPFTADARLGSARRTRFFDQTSWLPDNLLERGDRMLMAFGVEGRMPFMDVNLASLAATFPEKAVSNKWVLRSMMQKMLPESILARRKAGFTVPLDLWFRNDGRDRISDLLANPQSEIRQLCDSVAIDEMLEQHLSARHNHEQILWSLANMELFLRTFRPSLGAGQRVDDLEAVA